MRALAVALLLSMPAVAGAECFPSTSPAASESEKDVASLLCRTFRDLSATKATVTADRRGLVLSLTFEDLAMVDALGKPEVAKESLGEVLDALPELWKNEGKVMPAPVYLAVWTTDPTDRKPRVVWARKGPGSPLTVAKTDGLALAR